MISYTYPTHRMLAQRECIWSL